MVWPILLGLRDLIACPWEQQATSDGSARCMRGEVLSMCPALSVPEHLSFFQRRIVRRGFFPYIFSEIPTLKTHKITSAYVGIYLFCLFSQPEAKLIAF